MKKLFTILFLSLLFACNDKKKETAIVTPPPGTVRDTVPHVDNFDLKPTDFNIVKRDPSFLNFERGRKIKNPPPPPPPPVTPVVSLPGVILLDFDGFTVSQTSWNAAGDIVCTAAGLSIDEQQRILDTVAARYKMFNVIVTTSDTTYNKAAANKRVRCIITETYQWFGQAGGVSFIGSFAWGNNTPCFVFSLLLNYNTKMIYEAVCHEIGHSLGLYHQASYDGSCVKLSDYNYGNANFAPIMGVAYYSSSAGWVVGPNSYGCNTIQNDTLTIKNTLK